MRECIKCHFCVDDNVRYCLKCDTDLDLQTDGSVFTIDIAHHGQTREQAISEIDEIVGESKKNLFQYIRFIVGSGIISEEALKHLSWLQYSKAIIEFDFEPGNKGSILVKVKHDSALVSSE